MTNSQSPIPNQMPGRLIVGLRPLKARMLVQFQPSLKETPFAETGHPILLPGNPTAGSVIMAADAGAYVAAYSVNHGAGRAMGRKAAGRALDQKTVDDEFVANDILTNCRQYPKDGAPAAYKDFDAVLDSVKLAGLASEVARLKARFVIKDADMSLKGAA